MDARPLRPPSVATIRNATTLLLIGALASGCSSSLPTTSPSPSSVVAGLAVGSAFTCNTPALVRHCDAWLADARRSLAELPGASTVPASTAFHVGRWDPVSSRTTRVVAVVVFGFPDGTSQSVPVACSVYQPGDALCDTSDVSLPAN